MVIERSFQVTKDHAENRPATLADLLIVINELVAEGKGNYEATCNGEYRFYVEGGRMGADVEEDSKTVHLGVCV